MRITRLHIENFRSIKSLSIELGQTTVFVGPNNAGKTAILDAVRIALTRKWGQRGTGFSEYDIHLHSETDNPKSSPGIGIELVSEELNEGEWPDELHQDLDDIIQFDSVTGKSSITLRASCAWSAAEGCFEPSWTFLNPAREPLIGPSARRINLDRFFQYLPAFYLSALRDADDEFSSRSQFWGRLLKAMEIPSQLESRVQRVLDVLNKRILAADARLGEIAGTLSSVMQVAARDQDGDVDVRVAPLKSSDLLSKAEIILQNESGWPWLPLRYQGQGVQSLSVIFLFKAFVEHLLTELYTERSEPVLALEEPETHLHPQAARTLWKHVSALPGQKILSTHSPYFVQHTPFRDIRLIRLTPDGTKVFSLPPSFSTKIPQVDGLSAVVDNSGGALKYDRLAHALTVFGKLDEARYRDLLACYGAHANRHEIEGALRDLKERSALYITDDELRKLETFARRIRGEILFATKWMIVEGPAEYLIVHALARSLGYDFDEHGVAVIDAKNNGDPAIFAALARALSIPWLAVFDGDDAGLQYVATIAQRGFATDEVNARCRVLPAGNLEQQLLADGFESELRSLLQELGETDALEIDRATLEKRLDKMKTHCASGLSSKILGNEDLAQRMPLVFRETIESLRGL